MTKHLLRPIAIATALLVPAITSAQTDAAPSSTAPFGATRPVSDDKLQAVAGQSDLAQVVNAENRATVSGNTVSGTSQTGTIRFDSSAFQNLNGLSLLSANTGNNVSINASMNVNVAITAR